MDPLLDKVLAEANAERRGGIFTIFLVTIRAK